MTANGIIPMAPPVISIYVVEAIFISEGSIGKSAVVDVSTAELRLKPGDVGDITEPSVSASVE